MARLPTSTSFVQSDINIENQGNYERDENKRYTNYNKDHIVTTCR